MTDALVTVEELDSPGLRCAFCGDTYPQHDAGGGHCHAAIGGWSSPARAIPCPCPGFRWLPAGPPPPAYGGRPEQAWPGQA